LAEEIAERVQSLELALRGPGPEDEPFMKRLGASHGELQAIEMALASCSSADYEAEFRAEEVFLQVTDGDRRGAGTTMDPEDPGLEPLLEFWRQHHRTGDLPAAC